MSQVCEHLHRVVHSLERHRFPFDGDGIPLNGIYVLFEQGETGHARDRIVRVGTHTGKDQLQSRLKQHFLKENKDRSIFRKNIGRALLSRDNDPYLEAWEMDWTTSEVRRKHAGNMDAEHQRAIEEAVSRYIRESFSFVVLEISNKTTRLDMESKLISTVSLCKICRPSSSWLGLHSPKGKIRESGLWLVNELYKVPLEYDECVSLGQSVAVAHKTVIRIE